MNILAFCQILKLASPCSENRQGTDPAVLPCSGGAGHPAPAGAPAGVRRRGPEAAAAGAGAAGAADQGSRRDGRPAHRRAETVPGRQDPGPYRPYAGHRGSGRVSPAPRKGEGGEPGLGRGTVGAWGTE